MDMGIMVHVLAVIIATDIIVDLVRGGTANMREDAVMRIFSNAILIPLLYFTVKGFSA